jgi:hypothetical protein
MKKTLLLIISAFFAVSLIAQSVNDKPVIPDLQKQPGFDSKSLLVTGQKLDSTIAELWNVSDWTFSNRKKYSYSTVGLTTTVIGLKNLFPKDVGHPWANNDKTETTVDISGNITQYVSYTWNLISSLWVGSAKTEYVYTGSNLTKISTYIWNTGTSQWVGISKTENTYSGANIITEINYTWDNTLPIPDWVNSTKTENTYAGGVLTSDLTYNWNKTLSIWGIAMEKTEYAYTGGNLTTVTMSTWDTNTSAWVLSSKADYTYTNGRITLGIMSTWVTSQWVNSGKYEYTYDGSSRLVQYIASSWDTGGSVWVGLLQTFITYGTQGALNYSVSIGYTWDAVGGLWLSQTRTTNWYSDLATSIDKIPEKGLNVYPNPVKEFIVFDLPDISGSATVIIFDMQGKKVLEQQLSGNKQIAVNNLPKGMYVYKIISNGVTYSGKLLK